MNVGIGLPIGDPATTEVLLAPLRDTALLAKQAATLDRMTGGRLVLGLGIGGRDDDHQVTGIDPAHLVRGGVGGGEGDRAPAVLEGAFPVGTGGTDDCHGEPFAMTGVRPRVRGAAPVRAR